MIGADQFPHPLVEALEGRRLLSAAAPGGISGQATEIPTFLSPPLGPLPGWHVFLDLNRNGRPDGREPATTTNASGHYQFSNLRPGHYRATLLYPAGWVPADGSGRAWQDVNVRSGQISMMTFAAAPVLGGMTASLVAQSAGVFSAGSSGRITLRLQNDPDSPTATGKFDIALVASSTASVLDGTPLASETRTLHVAAQPQDRHLVFRIPLSLPAGTYELFATILPHGAPSSSALNTPASSPVVIR